MTKFKTVKRQAVAGERILITDATVTSGEYCNESVGTMMSRCPVVHHLIHVAEWSQPVSDEEYEVIVSAKQRKPTKNERITALEAEAQRQDEMLKASQDRILDLERKVSELQRKVSHKLVYDKLTESLVDAIEKAPKSPNEQRKAIIAEAKAFVAKVTQEMFDGEDARDGNETYKLRSTKPEFHVNSKKRAVTVLVKGANYGIIYEKAVAKAHPDDVFNADIGKAIALGRALGLDVTRFEKAVQPTELVPGMQTFHYHTNGRPLGERYVNETFVNDEGICVRDYAHHGKHAHVTFDEGDRILDDTEAQY